MKDSTQRFSDRVDDYVKFRPSYPPEVMEHLKAKFQLQSSHVIADIGSGTGISSELFLKNGNQVWGVEPNDEMRLEAEKLLSHYNNFKSIKGTSSATNLKDASIDMILVAQAFHWFEPISTKKEFQRILKKDGGVVILFNDRKTIGNVFAEQYESLLNEFGTDYKQVKHKNASEKRHREFLGDFEEFHFPNFQDLDFEALLGRLKSSSYVPKENDPRFPAMLQRLKEIFEDTHKEGIVRMEYDTQVYYARFS